MQFYCFSTCLCVSFFHYTNYHCLRCHLFPFQLLEIKKVVFEWHADSQVYCVNGYVHPSTNSLLGLLGLLGGSAPHLPTVQTNKGRSVPLGTSRQGLLFQRRNKVMRRNWAWCWNLCFKEKNRWVKAEHKKTNSVRQCKKVLTEKQRIKVISGEKSIKGNCCQVRPWLIAVICGIWFWWNYLQSIKMVCSIALFREDLPCSL